MIVKANALQKRYGSKQAVAEISFEVQPGEVFGLLGPNGAGKSTTLSMLAGLITPSAGTALIAGYDILRERDRAKRHLGLVPQDIALYPTLSARDNLVFWGQMYGLGGKYLAKRIETVLELVGLRERATERIETYSGGMKRRINLAAGLLHEPDVLLLDEPTVGVDPQSRNRIFEGIEHLKSEGLTLIYTSHYMEEVDRLCDRVAIVEDGRILALDSPRQLKAQAGGGSVTINLGTSGASVESCLRSLVGVTRVDLQDHLLTIEAANPQQTLVLALEVLNRADIPVQNIQLLEPSL
ncbi:MAG: ABC transporter ATP-binding protein, partial [Gemmatimonadaceae bacterium]|nr:ABC transporter ATP-binding protein [Gloeobacterales cyanobacterium ES-bin-141]